MPAFVRNSLYVLFAPAVVAGAFIGCSGGDATTAGPGRVADAQAADATSEADTVGDSGSSSPAAQDASDATMTADASHSDASDAGTIVDSGNHESGGDAGNDTGSSSDAGIADASDGSSSDASSSDAATTVSVLGSLFDYAAFAASGVINPPSGQLQVCLRGVPASCVTAGPSGTFSVGNVPSSTQAVLQVKQIALGDAGVGDAGDAGAPTYLDIAIAFKTGTSDTDTGGSAMISTTALATLANAASGGPATVGAGIVMVNTYDVDGYPLGGISATSTPSGSIFYVGATGTPTSTGPTTAAGYVGFVNLPLADGGVPIARITTTGSGLVCTVAPGDGWDPTGTETVGAPLFPNTVTFVSVLCQ